MLSLVQWNTSTNGFADSPSGFHNSGGTSYIASVLQLLAHAPPICQAIMKMSVPQHFSHLGANLIKEIGYIFHRMHDKGHRLIHPAPISKLLSSFEPSSTGAGPRFVDGRQEDAHDFLASVLDCMNTYELNSYGKLLPIPSFSRTLALTCNILLVLQLTI